MRNRERDKKKIPNKLRLIDKRAYALLRYGRIEIIHILRLCLVCFEGYLHGMYGMYQGNNISLAFVYELVKGLMRDTKLFFRIYLINIIESSPD